MEHTADELIYAIRTATDLNELKRLVGPAEYENEMERKRLEQVDSIWSLCQREYRGDLDALPWATKEKYDRLNREITEFENKYC
jgi:hypothetical protein